MARIPKIERFNENVLAKYQIYNSIFMTLPFDTITNTGVLLPLFSEVCEKGYDAHKNPTEIVENFFNLYQDNPSEKEKHDLLFRFIQYIERQVVLFDAIEDAAFPVVNNMDGRGTLRSIKEEAQAKGQLEELKEYLRRFKIRPTLTAHPTQFYPGTVLGIIHDLDKAIRGNDSARIKKLLAQLGKTAFFKKEKPTPYDEAVSLIWYLENVFYHSAGTIYNYIQQNIFEGEDMENDLINLGFWPGGDRDGNPFVTTETTLKVAKRLRKTVLINYYRDIRNLKRRITFGNLQEKIGVLETALYDNFYYAKTAEPLSIETLMNGLLEVKEELIAEHQSLFLEELQNLINKVKIFGFHFATLDIRQDSRIHHKVLTDVVRKSIALGLNIFPENYESLSDQEQIEILSKANGKLDPSVFEEDITRATLESIYAIKTIQEKNGERAANRYIISNNGNELNVMETFALIRLCDWELPTVDVIPLFETVPDLQVAHQVMESLYSSPVYMAHLKRRGMKQTIMLGFSDGTKDGGYLMANWGIFKAKEALTEVSRKYDVKVVFFDGRGGPPARGGGNTNQFYASLGPTVEDEEIQLTVQGQTISSNFGTLDSCQYNLEQLLGAGVENELTNNEGNLFSAENKETMQNLADTSYQAYVDFKNHPKFLPYLEHMSTLKYYGKANIGSRPSKRSKSATLDFGDLRAIPFVGSWSQLKQNVPGFYGVGTALKVYEDKGEFDKVISLYKGSPFFRTLVGNSMMSLTKSFFELTAYMKEDEQYGAFWDIIHDEYLLTKRLLFKLTGYSELMQNEPAGKASIDIRENIVLPLLTIQQYALKKIQEIQRGGNVDVDELEVYEKMVTRSLFGNINASRNSA
ncbi:phosphoenolpyruvate carboxylase [Aquimarina sp. AD10]|uniref:Phosphoenolpyruvate carboxylase n=1 Tax=Aquimarina aggregata TaxID=1642818 RepID=A0A163C8D6_9FLAO|nr:MULTISPECIES: phosphoenolpyruvate carboxylase [Aquimarina]AXT59861.1 phosphoenolpyruvate carboxylase [Aquimarina sp. AD10]KZS42152.1 phosphoenolpyruvate carboxylase [Aquimarina aggregata]RKN00222.1 phosphoenolpyruvate carboxylase [Aquimarina sp. AD10]